jgi:hypothetical protein
MIGNMLGVDEAKKQEEEEEQIVKEAEEFQVDSTDIETDKQN